MKTVSAGMSVFLAAALGCTDAGIYAAGAAGPLTPQVAFQGEVCIPLAAGDQFPVKVLFAVEGGQGINASVKGAILSGLTQFAGNQQNSANAFSFELVAFHTVATGLQGTFVPPSNPGFQTALTKLNSYQEVGPVSLRAPLELAESLLSGDMQSGCAGTVGRTRYIVVLIYTDQDTSCVNTSFNLGIDDRCLALLAPAANPTNASVASCGACELQRVTAELVAIGQQYGAGQLTVLPIYVTANPVVDGGADPAASEGQAIAMAGGTQFVETDPFANDLVTAIAGINTAQLQNAYVLKRFIAFNQNSLSRSGQLLVDSDGDGLSDDEELGPPGCSFDPTVGPCQGTDPLWWDTDHDGIGDGVEVKMGMNPLVPDVINGCTPDTDTDGDRLLDCEEKVLGTNPCMSDTDGDGIPDFVEVLSGTDPLIPEDLQDTDRDGVLNADEVINHTDPLSADTAYAAQYAYHYSVTDAPPTPDGRLCYTVTAENINLTATQSRPNPISSLYPAVKKGNNDLYLYMQAGLPNQPHGVGITSLQAVSVQRLSPTQRRPSGVINITPDQFVVGY